MGSIAAKAVAQEVISEVRKGKKPNLQVIQQKHGYSKSSAVAMKAKRTQDYKDVMKPILRALEKERNRIMDELSNKDLTKEKYRDLIDGLDKITKNHQLLSGGTTENVGIKPIADVFVINGIQNSNSDTQDSEAPQED